MKTIKDIEKYWDTRPCNIRHSPEEIGTLAWSNGVTDRKYLVEPHIKSFVRFDLWRNKQVLEIGCGIGTDTLEFAKAGAWVTAVDLSSASIAIANDRVALHGLSDRVRFIKANVEELEALLKPKEYDLIYSFGVLHHTPNPAKAFKSLLRYMGPGSILKVMVYHKWSWKVFWIVLKYGYGAFWNVDQLVAKYSEAQVGCPITYTYSKLGIKELLKDYQIFETRVEHIFPYAIPEYIRYKYKKVWYFRWMPARMFKWLESVLGWHLCITAKVKAPATVL